MNTTEKQSTVTHSHAANAAAPKSPRLGLWLTATIVIVGVGVAVGIVPRLKARETLKQETELLRETTVSVTSTKQGQATPLLELPAEVKPFADAPIFARANGYLKKYYVDIGAKVKAGDLLGEIDTPEVDRELESARAALTRDEAALDLAKTTATRWQELLKTASVSDQEAAEKKADLALKAATVEASRANVHRLEELKRFAKVVAPFEGTVTARNVDLGDLINAGSGQPIFHLSDTGRLRVFVHVPQTVASQIQAGVTAELIIPDAKSRKYAAKVVRTAGTIDPASRTLLAELEVDNSRGEILAGSYAQVSFSEVKQETATVLPSNVLIFRSEGTQVAVVEADGKIQMHEVTLGRDFGRTVEVLSGVSASDKVVLNPPDSLTAGQAVRVAANEEKK